MLENSARDFKITISVWYWNWSSIIVHFFIISPSPGASFQTTYVCLLLTIHLFQAAFVTLPSCYLYIMLAWLLLLLSDKDLKFVSYQIPETPVNFYLFTLMGKHHVNCHSRQLILKFDYPRFILFGYPMKRVCNIAVFARRLAKS